MAARTYLFGWIKSWRNPVPNGKLPTQSKMGPNSKSKVAYGGHGDDTWPSSATFDPSNCFNPEPINSKFGIMGKIHELHLPYEFERNPFSLFCLCQHHTFWY